MSRAKYSPEKQRAIMATFIDAAAHVIQEEGIEAISIRNVASRAGYSSATLYLYFDDINQLVALASVSHLRDYVAEIASKVDSFEDPKDRYLFTWEAFCRHSFANAAVFSALFFGQYGNMVDETVKRYYSIFPQELEQISPQALTMLMAGDLYKRNMNILKPYSTANGFTAEREQLVNDMTVSYYRMFLDRARAERDTLNDETIEQMTQEFMEGANWLLDK